MRNFLLKRKITIQSAIIKLPFYQKDNNLDQSLLEKDKEKVSVLLIYIPNVMDFRIFWVGLLAHKTSIWSFTGY